MTFIVVSPYIPFNIELDLSSYHDTGTQAKRGGEERIAIQQLEVLLP